MTARPEFDFEKYNWTMPNGNKWAMPNGIKDIEDLINYRIDGDGFHYAGDNRGKDGGPYRKGPESEIPRKIVAAIKEGDLDALKAIAVSELKKYLNNEVLRINYGMIRGMCPKGQVNGFTPLMLAAIEGKTDIMRYLIEQGADIGIKTFDLGRSGFLNGLTATDYLRNYKLAQEKKRAEELRKKQELDAKQKEKDELNALMDEVDGKKPLPELSKPKEKKGGTVREEIERMKKEKGTRVDGPQIGKKPKKGQFGNGKGIDDLIGKMQEGDKVKGRPTGRVR